MSDDGLLAFVKAEQFEFETFLIKGKCEKLAKRNSKRVGRIWRMWRICWIESIHEWSSKIWICIRTGDEGVNERNKRSVEILWKVHKRGDWTYFVCLPPKITNHGISMRIVHLLDLVNNLIYNGSSPSQGREVFVLRNIHKYISTYMTNPDCMFWPFLK